MQYMVELNMAISCVCQIPTQGWCKKRNEAEEKKDWETTRHPDHKYDYEDVICAFSWHIHVSHDFQFICKLQQYVLLAGISMCHTAGVGEYYKHRIGFWLDYDLLAWLDFASNQPRRGKGCRRKYTNTLWLSFAKFRFTP